MSARTPSLVVECGLPAVALAAAEILRVRGVNQRALMAGWLLVLVGGGLRLLRQPGAPRDTSRGRLLPGLTVVAFVSLLIAIAPALLMRPTFVSYTQSVLPVLSMLAVTVWLRWDEGPTVPTPEWLTAITPSRWLLGTLLFYVVAVIVGHRVYVGPFPEVTDEASYMLAAKWISNPNFAWHVDPALADFFSERHLVDRPGQLATEYPPGWPAALALFQAVGLTQWWGVVVGSVTLVITYRLGVLLVSARVAALAVVLLATSQWFLEMHASYMSHGVTMCALAAGALAMVEAERRHADGGAAIGRVGLWIAAGAALSFGVAARPLTGVALGIGLVLAVWLRRPTAPIGERLLQGMLLAVGAVPGIAGVFYYNAQTTGSPLLFGYTAVYGSLHAMGFGQRGFMVYDASLKRVPFANAFTPKVALANFSTVLANAVMSWVPVGATAPLLLAARQAQIRLRLGAWWPLLFLPVTYFFYFFEGLRFWFEAMPYFCIGLAWLFLALIDRRPAIGRQLLACAIVGQVAFAVAAWDENPYLDRPWHNYAQKLATKENFANVEALRATHGKLLIFARESGPGFAPLRDRLMSYNGDGEAGEVLVARDLGVRNAELMRRHPDRAAFLFIRKNATTAATIEPIPPLR